jgi:hypothetical protein
MENIFITNTQENATSLIRDKGGAYCFLGIVRHEYNPHSQLLNQHFYAHSQNCKKRLLASSCPSIHPLTWNKLAPTEWILIKFDI